MKRKSEIVRELVSGGRIKEALRIAKGFRRGITKEQQNKMSMAYECIMYPDFYKRLGHDIGSEIEAGTAVLLHFYGSK